MIHPEECRECRIVEALPAAELDGLDITCRKLVNRCGHATLPADVRYVHPEVFTSYLDGNLVLDIKSEVESELRDELAG
jgi:hypothetical protein